MEKDDTFSQSRSNMALPNLVITVMSVGKVGLGVCEKNMMKMCSSEIKTSAEDQYNANSIKFIS